MLRGQSPDEPSRWGEKEKGRQNREERREERKKRKR